MMGYIVSLDETSGNRWLKAAKFCCLSSLMDIVTYHQGHHGQMQGCFKSLKTYAILTAPKS